MGESTKKEKPWFTKQGLESGMNKRTDLPNRAVEVKVEGVPNAKPTISDTPPQPDVPSDPNTYSNRERAMAEEAARKFEEAGRPMGGAKDD